MTTNISRRKVLASSLIFPVAASISTLPMAAEKSGKAQVTAETYDVIVLGAGPAGLTTAITAKEQGAKKVILFEKRDRPSGNSLFAIGGICGWGSKVHLEAGVEDTRDKFLEMMLDVSQHKGDKELNRVYTDNISEGINWLANDIGVQFGIMKDEPYPLLSRVVLIKGNGLTGGSVLVKKLLEAAKSKGVEIRYEHAGIQLLHNDKMEVTGVRVQTPEGQKDFYSRGGIAIATGGYSANPEMVCKYIGGWATRLILRGSDSVTGSNVSLPMPLNAKFVNMDQFHCGPIIEQTHMNPANLLNSGYGIQVNSSGERFMDERNTYVIKARRTGESTKDNMAFVVIDSSWPGISKDIARYNRLNTTYGRGNTVEEAAEAMGLPGKKISKLVDEYNDAVQHGTLNSMVPPCSYQNPHLISKAPFYVIPFQGGMTATFGGPLINGKSEVINLDGKPIPGLYAVGNSSGGIFFYNYAGGAQLGAATVFGRIAGKEMARRALTK